MRLPNIYARMADAEFNLRLQDRTGFESIAAMISECKSTYRPTCDCSDPFQRTLAYRFDAAMYAAGDDRRAFLSGTDSERDLARWGQ